MRMVEEILFFFPDPKVNSPALRRAARFAALNEARLTVVNVLEPPPGKLYGLRGLTATQLRERMAMEAQERMEKAIAPWKREGLKIGTKLFFGTPFLEIIREVQRYGYDLVMLAAEGKPRGLWFGSTATHLIRKCPCPVWVLKPKPPRKYQEILVAIDPDPDDPTKLALSRKLMEFASSLARAEGSGLHIVRVWDAYGEHLLRTSSGVSAAKVQQYVSQVKRSHEDVLEGLLLQADLRDVTYKVHLVRGDPGIMIARLAEKLGIEVIVMGTVGRTGIAGFVIGNTAEKVLQQVHCAVLTVKPNGFVCPVKFGRLTS